MAQIHPMKKELTRGRSQNPIPGKQQRIIGFFSCEETNVVGRGWEGGAHWVNCYEIDAWSTGILACPFAYSLAPLTHSLVSHCSLCSRT